MIGTLILFFTSLFTYLYRNGKLWVIVLSSIQYIADIASKLSSFSSFFSGEPKDTKKTNDEGGPTAAESDTPTDETEENPVILHERVLEEVNEVVADKLDERIKEVKDYIDAKVDEIIIIIDKRSECAQVDKDSADIPDSSTGQQNFSNEMMVENTLKNLDTMSALLEERMRNDTALYSEIRKLKLQVRTVFSLMPNAPGAQGRDDWLTASDTESNTGSTSSYEIDSCLLAHEEAKEMKKIYRRALKRNKNSHKSKKTVKRRR